MNRWLQRCKAAGKTFLAAFAVFLLNTQTAYASGISESKLAKGTEKLIGDATTWLMVLAPVVAGLLIIYFCIRRRAAYAARLASTPMPLKGSMWSRSFAIMIRLVCSGENDNVTSRL